MLSSQTKGTDAMPKQLGGKTSPSEVVMKPHLNVHWSNRKPSQDSRKTTLAALLAGGTTSRGHHQPVLSRQGSRLRSKHMLLFTSEPNPGPDSHSHLKAMKSSHGHQFCLFKNNGKTLPIPPKSTGRIF